MTGSADESPSEQQKGDGDVSKEQALLDALLQTHYESAESRELRIDRVLAGFDRRPRCAVLEASPLLDQPTRPNLIKKVARTRRWMMATSACGILMLMGAAFFLFTPPSAEAALARAIEAAEQSTTRVYDLEISGKRRQVPFQRRAPLYSQSAQIFAIEATDARVTPLVFGMDQDGAWLVVGKHLRRHETDQDMLPFEGYFLNRVTMGMLNVNRLLTHIRGNYDIQLGKRAPIPAFKGRFARPLVATLSSASFRLPKSIRIWPDPQTGMALRMEIEMPPVRGVRGVEKVVATFKRNSDKSHKEVTPEIFLRSNE